MEAIILFLVQAVASGTVGHYLKKALTEIDADVASLITSGASVKEIERAIENKHVTAQVEDIFKESISNSTILSTDLGAVPTIDDKVQLFQSVVSLGFGLAHDENFDVVLPGSPFGSDSLSVFGSDSSIQSVRTSDRSIEWNRYVAKYYIVPMPQTQVAEYWQKYLKEVRELRAESNNKRLLLGKHISNPAKSLAEFEVERLTGGKVYFQTESLMKTPSLSYADWNTGIQAMFEGIVQIRDVNVLPPEDREKLRDIAIKLNEVVSKSESAKRSSKT